MKNTSFAINSTNNQMTRISPHKKNFSIIAAIWNSQVAKYFLSVLIISVAGLILFYVHVHIYAFLPDK